MKEFNQSIEKENRTSTYILPFSAKSEESLYQKLVDMSKWLLENENCNLDNLAYTLAVGRSHFSKRMAIVVTSLKELKEVIMEKKNQMAIDDNYFGQRKRITHKNEDNSDLIKIQKLDKLSIYERNKAVNKLCKLYESNYDIEWEDVYESDNYLKISIPTYPFRRNKHWFSADKNNSSIKMEVLCPVIDKNISTFNEQIFEKKLDGKEFFLKDHIVSNRMVLPGVVHIEMAVWAVRHSIPNVVINSVKNVTWHWPVELKNGEPNTTVQIRIFQSTSDGEVGFEVISKSEDEVIIHSEGTMIYSDQLTMNCCEKLNIKELLKNKKILDGDEIYSRFRDYDLNLGKSFQSIKKVYIGEKEAVSFIELPQHLTKEFNSYVLHPTIIDGLLEGVISLVKSDINIDGVMALPYSFEKMEMYSKIPNCCVAYIKKVESEKTTDENMFDVDLLNDDGEILLKIKNFLLKEVHPARAHETKELSFTYQWKKHNISKESATKRVHNVVLFDDNSLLTKSINYSHFGEMTIVKFGEEYQLNEDGHHVINPFKEKDYEKLFRNIIFEKGDIDLILTGNDHEVISTEDGDQLQYRVLLYIAKSLIKLKVKNIRFMSILIGNESNISPYYKAKKGFYKTVRLENKGYVFSNLCIDYRNIETIIDIIRYEFIQLDDDVLYSKNERFVNSVVEIDQKKIELPTERIFRNSGVYCILGGAGKLSMIVSNYLVKHFNAKLILIGRSGLSKQGLADIEDLREMGGEVCYLIADGCDKEALIQAVQKGEKELGAINGTIHCAGTIADAYIANKNIDESQMVINIKTMGCINLDEATKNSKLDFFIGFSSIAAIIGNYGQSDYAYANAFIDGYMSYREKLVDDGKRFGKSISINWPLWNDGGMSIDNATIELSRKAIGIVPLTTSIGLKYLESSIRGKWNQIIVAVGERRKILKVLGLINEQENTVRRHINHEDMNNKIHEDLKSLISKKMAIDIDDIYVDEDIEQYGFNSLTLSDLANDINAKYNILTTPALFFQYPTIRTFSEYIVSEYSENLVEETTKTLRDDHELTSTKDSAINHNDIEQSYKKVSKSIPSKNNERELEGIAVIGISGVMPKSRNMNEFWNNLERENNLVSIIPDNRWDHELVNNIKGKKVNKTISKWGSFIDDVDKFDREFFNINPREAALMDPQQRLFMQTVWSTVEDSGYKMSDFAGSKTGLFVGVSTSDYGDILHDNQIDIEAYSSTGMSHCILANRISYLFDWNGPSEPIDTACSSSLVAVHRGVESIRNGDCDQAVVGGVNVMISPTLHISFSKAGMLSPDGRCKTFDKGANGYVRGEGVGAILLKSLKKAEEDGDYIYGVIKGTAINHGGKVSSLTVPNPNLQAKVLKSAYKKAGVRPENISYIEAHGTGTNLGDPVEINALKLAFKEMYEDENTSQDEHNYCGIGTVKTNIGHLEAAAGIAGVLKVILSLKAKKLPGIVNFNELNPYIDLENSPFYIVEKTKEWKKINGCNRIAGVSSFGFGGANAHVVIEEYENTTSLKSNANEVEIIIFSAKNTKQLKQKVEEFNQFITEIINNPKMNKDFTIKNVAHTLMLGREEMSERLAFCVNNFEELIEKLNCYLDGCLVEPKIYVNSVELSKRSNKNNAAMSLEEIESDKYDEIAKLWTSGVNIQWASMFKGEIVRRLPLPTYPFEKVECWVKKVGKKILPLINENETKEILHPMIDKNVSTMEEIKFKKVLRIEEKYLKDHIVGGKILLPGVAYLEMVRAAANLAGITDVTRLVNVKWVKPIEMKLSRKDIYIGFSKDIELIKFSVFSMENETKQLHSHGCISIEELNCAKIINISSIIERSEKQLSKDECYNTIFKKVGFDYGETFKVTQRAYCSEEEGLARLELSEEIAYNVDEFMLHPSILDGAIRSISWVGRRTADDLVLRVPFAMDSIEILGKIPRSCFAYAKLSDNANGTDDSGTKKYDIQIVNDDGEEVVRIFGFAIKQYKSSHNVNKDIQTLFFSPHMEIQALKTIDYSRETKLNSVMIFGTKEQYYFVKDLMNEKKIKYTKIILIVKGGRYEKKGENIYSVSPSCKADYEKVFEQLKKEDINIEKIIHAWDLSKEDDIKENRDFSLSETLEKNGGIYSVLNIFQSVYQSSGEVKCVYGYDNSFGNRLPLSEMVVGFSKAHATKNPLFKLISVGLEGLELRLILNVLLNELINPQFNNGMEIVYKLNLRFEKKLIEIAVEEKNVERRLRENGVYIITGGNGELGLKVARLLGQKYKAKLVLTGRRTKDNKIRREIEYLNSIGAEAIYIEGDISIRNDIKKIIVAGKNKFGEINGIFHCAGIGDETELMEATKESFEKVLLPKVQGTIYLDEESKNENLDVFVLFSSIAAIIGDLGVCSYSAANTFMDKYVVLREQLRSNDNSRSGNSISINWPLWKDGRYSIDSTQEVMLENYFGLLPLDDKVGLDALETIVNTMNGQVVVAYGQTDKIRNVLGVTPSNELSVISENEVGLLDDSELVDNVVSYLSKIFSETLNLPLKKINRDSSIDTFGIDSMMIMELNDRLNIEFKDVSKTLFYEYTTINALALYFVKKYRARVIDMFCPLSIKIENPIKNNDKIEFSSEILPKYEGSQKNENYVRKHLENDFMDIAVIGLDGRFPMAKNTFELWENLVTGRDCISEIPLSRWDYKKDYDPLKGKKGKIYTKYGGFIDDVDKFDPLFFQMTPKDARLTDPQERIFLECAYHTIEDAGYTRKSISKDKVGVFVGVMYGHYQLIGTQMSGKDGAMAPNSSFASIANRVSYLFDLKGPSIAIDTMCSSSLTAIHLACESIRSGSSDMAIAGGVNVTIHKNKYVFLCNQRFASSEGKCRAFGDGGDGYVASEGVGAVLLKPLHKALADRDNIYGVIKGSAINAGGKTSGYTVPNPNAQSTIIKEVLDKSNVDPRDITYIEAHGTGTSLGDPIEIAGLTNVYNEYTDEKQYCSIGSIKSNIGHLESAAGIASVTKVLLQLRHKQLVPSIHSECLNEHINFADSPFVVQRELEPWENNRGIDGKSRRTAAVSSFGAGGANAHLIIDEFSYANIENEKSGEQVIIFSAMTKEILIEKMQMFLKFIENSSAIGSEHTLTNIAYTLQIGREEMEERIGIVVSTIDELTHVLREVLSGKKNMINVYRGNKSLIEELDVDIIGSDKDDFEFIELLIKRNNVSRLLKLWTLGSLIEWNKLYDGLNPRKVSLPLYPFAKERYWIDRQDDISESQYSKVLHPLIDTNISTLRVQKYRKKLSIDEFYLRDHIVENKILLPGVAFIEMARAAGELAGEMKVNVIRDVEWLKPIVMTEATKEVDILIRPNKNSLTFEIVSHEGEKRVLHSRGKLELTNKSTDDIPRHFDISSIKERCTFKRNKDDCYNNVFKEIGFDYGLSFQVTEEVLSGEKETIAKLSLNEGYRADLEKFILHPALFDGALRSVAAGNRDESARGTHIPFSLGNMRIYGAIPAECYVYTKVIEQPDNNNSSGLNIFDISIIDNDGKEVVTINDFIVRPFRKKSDVKKIEKAFYYTTNFEKKPLKKQSGHINCVLVFGEEHGLTKKITNYWACNESLVGNYILVKKGSEYSKLSEKTMTIDPNNEEHYVRLFNELKENRIVINHILHLWNSYDRQMDIIDVNSITLQTKSIMETGIFSIINLFKAFEHVKYTPHMKLVCVHKDKDELVSDEVIASFGNSIITLNHNFKITSIQCDEKTLTDASINKTLTDELLVEAKSSDKEIKYIECQRFIAVVNELLPSESSNKVEFKESGVYLITGGAGALGAIFAKYIAQKYKGKLILTGRKPINNEINRLLEHISKLGGEATYLQSDISKREDMKMVIDNLVSKNKKLDGILHCAGIGGNKAIVDVNKDSVEEILAPKVEGLINLDYATKDMDVDFMLLFSSISADLGDLGVGSYSIANSFMNKYATSQKLSKNRKNNASSIISINWPLWKTGGFDLPEEEEQFYYKHLGMRAIDEQFGVAVIENILELNLPKVIVACGEKEKIDKALKVDKKRNMLQVLERIKNGDISTESFKEFLGGAL